MLDVNHKCGTVVGHMVDTSYKENQRRADTCQGEIDSDFESNAGTPYGYSFPRPHMCAQPLF